MPCEVSKLHCAFEVGNLTEGTNFCHMQALEEYMFWNWLSSEYSEPMNFLKDAVTVMKFLQLFVYLIFVTS